MLGKHTKRIKCGCWSKQSLLALASDDHSLSVSNSDGDTLRQFSMQGDASDVQFSEMKADERSNLGENTVSCNCVSHVRQQQLFRGCSNSNYHYAFATGCKINRVVTNPWKFVNNFKALK